MRARLRGAALELTRVAVRSHVRATLGDPSSKFSLYPAPVTNCRCAAAIPCDGTICGGRRLGEGGEEEGAWRLLALALPSLSLTRRPGEDAAAPRTGAARSNAAAAAAAALEATMEDVEDPCAPPRPRTHSSVCG